MRKYFQKVSRHHMAGRILYALSLRLKCNGRPCSPEHAHVRVSITNRQYILGSQTKLLAQVK
jgi:hypothetical protein